MQDLAKHRTAGKPRPSPPVPTGRAAKRASPHCLAKLPQSSRVPRAPPRRPRPSTARLAPHRQPPRLPGANHSVLPTLDECAAGDEVDVCENSEVSTPPSPPLPGRPETTTALGLYNGMLSDEMLASDAWDQVRSPASRARALSREPRRGLHAAPRASTPTGVRRACRSASRRTGRTRAACSAGTWPCDSTAGRRRRCGARAACVSG